MDRVLHRPAPVTKAVKKVFGVATVLLVRTHTHIHIHVHTHTYTYIYIHRHTQIHRHSHKLTHKQAPSTKGVKKIFDRHTYIYIHLHTYKLTRTQTHNTHLHTETHKQMHIPIHIHSHTDMLGAGWVSGQHACLLIRRSKIQSPAEITCGAVIAVAQTHEVSMFSCFWFLV